MLRRLAVSHSNSIAAALHDHNVALPHGSMGMDAGQIAGDGSTEIVAGSGLNG